jgi:hypothetical protein
MKEPYKSLFEAQPPKSLLNQAVKLMQLYIGSDNKVNIKTAQKFYDNLMKIINKLSNITGNTEDNLFNQIEKEAKKRGIITPLPGKDY